MFAIALRCYCYHTRCNSQRTIHIVEVIVGSSICSARKCDRISRRAYGAVVHCSCCNGWRCSCYACCCKCFTVLVTGNGCRERRIRVAICFGLRIRCYGKCGFVHSKVYRNCCYVIAIVGTAYRDIVTRRECSAAWCGIGTGTKFGFSKRARCYCNVASGVNRSCFSCISPEFKYRACNRSGHRCDHYVLSVGYCSYNHFT